MYEHREIEAELRRIEEASEHSAQSQFSQAKFWRGVNVLLGMPAAILAAVAGATALYTTAGRLVAAILALLAAGLGAVQTTLNAARRHEQAHKSANDYLALQNDARVLREVDLRQQERQEAREALELLAGRRTELNEAADIPAFFAYWAGRRNIEKGRTKYRDEV